MYRLQIKALHISFAGVYKVYKVQPFVFPYYRPGCFSIKTQPPELVFFAYSGPEITRKLNFFKGFSQMFTFVTLLVNFTFTVSFFKRNNFFEILTV